MITTYTIAHGQLVEVRIAGSQATARAWYRDDRHESGMTAAAYALTLPTAYYGISRGEVLKFAAREDDHEARAAANRLIALDRRVEALESLLGEAILAADALAAPGAWESPETPETTLLRQLLEQAQEQVAEALTACLPPIDVADERPSTAWLESQIVT